MQAPQIVAHTKILFSIMVGAALGAMAWLDLQANAPMLALITASLSMLMVINGLLLLLARGHAEQSYLEGLFIFLLASFSIWATWQQGGQAAYWMYFYPLAAFFLFSLKTAAILVGLYLPAAGYVTFRLSDPLIQAQICFTFTSVTLVTLFMAIVKARTNQLLEPLVSADLTTGAQQEKRLHPELSIEINRAEREGTGLLLMLIGTGAAVRNAGRSNRTRLMQEAASAIATHLRPFDSFYRLHTDDFAVVLPHTTSAEAKNLSGSVLRQLPKSLQQQTTLGMTSLNVDDTAESMLANAKAQLNAANLMPISPVEHAL